MKKQKYISKKWFILLAVVLLLIPVTAYAALGDAASAGTNQAATVSGQAVSSFNQVLNAMVGFLSQVLQLLQKILWPLFLAIGGLMNNDLLFGAGMEERLLSIWVQIRNLVNIIFVVALLGIALYNVTGFSKEGDYQLKTFLPKFVIALILVNFTFIGLKFVLDVSNVLTNVVFTLPQSISAELATTQVYLPKEAELADYVKANNISDKDLKKIQTNIDSVCKAMFGTYEQAKAKKTAYLAQTNKDPKQDPSNFYCEVDTNKNVYVLTDNGRKFFQKYSSRNSPLVLAVQMMKVVDVDKISDALKGTSPNLSKLTFNILFSVIIYLIYAVAYVVLFVVLLARLVFLWIIIALSPLIALKIVFSKLPTGDKDFLSLFITNAFVPVLIGIPLTIGYIMLGALQDASSPITQDFNLNTLFNLETSGVSDLQTMVIAFGAVAVVWFGVFAAAEKSIAASVVQAIKSRVRGAGTTLARATRFLPIIPAAAGNKGRASIAQLSSLATAPLRRLQERYGGEFGGKTISKYNIEALARTKRTGSARELQQFLAQGVTNPKFQKPLGQVVGRWSRSGTKEQKKLAQEISAKIGPAGLRRFERGQLKPEEARQIQQYAQGQIASPLGTPRTTKPGAAKTPANADAQRAQKFNQVRHAAELGYIPTTNEAYTASQAGKTAEFDAYAKGHTNEMKVYAAISASNDSLKNAQDKAKEISRKNMTEAEVKDAAAQLKTHLTSAKTTLKGKGLSPAQIKKVLQDIVQKQYQNKQTDFYKTDSGKAIRDLINS